MTKRKIIANWKMGADLELAETLVSSYKRESYHLEIDLTVCPSFVHIPFILGKLKHNREISFGAQDVSVHKEGAFTGEVSAKTLKELECSYVIVGHSECRTHHHDTNEVVVEKIKRVVEAGLAPIVCIGETAEERKQGKTKAVVLSQLKSALSVLKKSNEFMIAYEPVWAIGTGVSATAADIQDAHGFIHAELAGFSHSHLVYGGSVNAKNALEILSLPHVDGVLVGGASLKVDEFNAICRAASKTV